MSTEITLIGNEGFRITTREAVFYTDPFYGAIPGVTGSRALEPDDVKEADLILITHSHWDHFRCKPVAEVAKRTGAKVVAPADVVNGLAGKLPGEQLVEVEPSMTRRGEPYGSRRVELDDAQIIAYRTQHGQGHNSYLVRTPTFTFFHDGDNEDTRRIDPAALGDVDALLIGPWQGSGWAEFIEAVKPKRYFLMHLTDEELGEIDAGTFLPAICDHVPEGLVVLRPGQSFVLD